MGLCTCAGGFGTLSAEVLDGEVVMDFLGSPVWLGGILMCVALGAWSLGLKQGRAVIAGVPDAPSSQPPGPSLAQDRRAPPEAELAAPCQQQARAERLSALSEGGSLALLHAEVSAYRQRERIFAVLPEDAWRIDDAAVDASHDCRYLGLTGEPTCGLPRAAIPASGCSGSCCSLAAVPVSNASDAQLSPELAVFTRV